MRPTLRWLTVAASLLLTFGLCGPGRAAVSTHLSWGQIAQSRLYDDPNLAAPLHLFMMQLETDASVSYVEFLTPAGFLDVIPSDEYTASGDIETYHWIDADSTHVWEYWGYFEDPAVLDDYGDGLYVVIVHYTNGTKEQTSVWYGIPGSSQPIPTPTQRPKLLWPPYDDVVASPVSFTWEPVTDPSVGDIYLNVLDPGSEYVVSDVYDVDATASDPYSLNEGRYQIEFALEHFYATTNLDGIPFDLLKSSTVLQPFEVVAARVYRFWSPVTGRHFYTIDEAEKNKLINSYSHVWTFEGPVFYAWATQYDPNMMPVYRFWSNRSSSHFYTLSESEKNKLVTTYSHVWAYEGVAFYAYGPNNPPADTSPVFRFWNASDSTHFYTIDPGEKDKLVNRYPDIYTFERIAFYAWP
jgi:hypothetical protein